MHWESKKQGFETLGLVEFDKDAADSLKINRPNWRVINDDIANISCLDLEEYFGFEERRVGSFIWWSTVPGHFPMLERGLALRMQGNTILSLCYLFTETTA